MQVAAAAGSLQQHQQQRQPPPPAGQFQEAIMTTSGGDGNSLALGSYQQAVVMQSLSEDSPAIISGNQASRANCAGMSLQQPAFVGVPIEDDNMFQQMGDLSPYMVQANVSPHHMSVEQHQPPPPPLHHQHSMHHLGHQQSHHMGQDHHLTYQSGSPQLQGFAPQSQKQQEQQQLSHINNQYTSFHLNQQQQLNQHQQHQHQHRQQSQPMHQAPHFQSQQQQQQHQRQLASVSYTLNNNITQQGIAHFPDNSSNQTLSPSFSELKLRLDIITQRTQKTDQLLKMLQEKQEHLIIHAQARGKLLQSVEFYEQSKQVKLACQARADLTALTNSIAVQAHEFRDQRDELFGEQQDIFDHISTIQRILIDDKLGQWHMEQQFAINNISTDANFLDKIQKLVEMLIECSLRLRNQLKNFFGVICAVPKFNFSTDQLNALGLRLTSSIEELILRTFVIEKQPPQVMKTNTRFPSTIRFLAGGRLNVQMTSPDVRATILSETNARSVIQKHRKIIQSAYAQAHMTQLPPHTHSAVYQQQEHIDSTTADLLDDSPPESQAPVLHQQYHLQQQQQPIQCGQQQHLGARTSNNQEQQSHEFMSIKKILNINDFDPSGEILNPKSQLDYNDASRQIVCHYRNMQLKKIRRAEKKGTESVMDEKFVLLFHCEFHLPETYGYETNPSGGPPMRPAWIQPNGILSFHLMAFSLPVVVIVHGNQESHAWATVTWHNAFARPDDVLYRVPDKVRWQDLGDVLSSKFQATVGRELNEQHLRYLAAKVTRAPVTDYQSTMVTWSQFAKEAFQQKLSGSFTFWEWFHAILKLTREHLRDLWCNNLIYGFLDRTGTMEVLFGNPPYDKLKPGTFLMRFSETELGGITIAWLANMNMLESDDQLDEKLSNCISVEGCEFIIMHLQPFVAKDLLTRKLADRIRDLANLVHLHPNRDKDECLRDFYTPLNETESATNGYVRQMLVQTIATDYPKRRVSSLCDEYSSPPPSSSSYQARQLTPNPALTPSYSPESNQTTGLQDRCMDIS